MKNVMYKTKILTENLEATELNIIAALMLLTHTIDSLTKVRDDNMSVDNLIESAIIFAKQLNINPEEDFNRHHRRRLKPKKIDSNASTQCTINLKTFYRVEFKNVFDTLIHLCSEHLKNCMLIIELLMTIFKVPLENNCSIDDLKKAMQIFPLGCDESDICDYDGVMAKLNILHHHCINKNIF